MSKRATRPDRDNPEWTQKDFERARPALEALPAELAAILPRRRGQRGPGKEPAKKLVSIRVDPDVLDRFRSTGVGWQTRINDALRRAARGLR